MINVIGGGLAGCEAAFQIAKRGVEVRLYDMKPGRKSPAHSMDGLCELVCSNSFRSDRVENAAGLLKAEMRKLGSLIMQSADNSSVAAGGALAVDRAAFSAEVTKRLLQSGVEIVSREILDLSELYGTKIIATGPLTDGALAENIGKLTGEPLFFYDATAPIVAAESVDMTSAFVASRYGRGDGYINCPMNKEEYLAFYEALITAETAGQKDFEKNIFEGCMPIEAMAMRGVDTMRFGPLKPVGLLDPRTGLTPYAVLQLRAEDNFNKNYNLVGCQTHLKWPEQKRVFGKIPALANAEFLRYGVMHRNSYINSPKLLDGRLRLKSDSKIFFAGQITGVEGYIESAACGLAVGIFAAEQYRTTSDDLKTPTEFSDATAIGALIKYVGRPSSNFQPSNINFGIMQSIDIRNKKLRNDAIAARALDEIDRICANREQ